VKYAVISDVHANPEALRRVLDDARRCGAEKVVCLGDVVGYGPGPAEAVALVRESAALAIAGNHDDAVSGRGDSSAFIGLAADAAERHRDALSADARAWLGSLPYTCELQGAVATHGDITDPKSFAYIEDESDAAANFEATDAQLVFVGHTHVPTIFLTGRSGTVYKTEPQDFELEDGKRYIVNPGSVGYPREADGKCMSSYVLYDSDAHTVRFRFLPFSVASVMQRGKGSGRAKAWIFAALAATSLAVAAAAGWIFVGNGSGGQDDALVLERRELGPLDGLKGVRANLKLERGSAPVRLRVTCMDADGRTLSDESTPVKASSTKAFPVPAGAAKAELTILRLNPSDKPRIAEFAPTGAGK